MFKLASLSGVALGVLSTVAVAADLPSRKAPVPFLAPPPVFTWTGFYLGLNAGAAIRTQNNTNNAFAFLAPAAFGAFGNNNGNSVGFVGGGQVGYNFQSGPVVFGLEADAQYRSSIGGNSGGFGSNGNAGFYGTARGRVGFLVSPQWLLYITGGAAFGNTFTSNNYAYALLFPGLIGFNNGSNNSFRVGYAAGGGLEYAFSPNWSVKAEALYNDLGRSNVGVFGAGPRTQFVTARLGVNYRFNFGGPGSVVARY